MRDIGYFLKIRKFTIDFSKDNPKKEKNFIKYISDIALKMLGDGDQPPKFDKRQQEFVLESQRCFYIMQIKIIIFFPLIFVVCSLGALSRGKVQ